MEDYVGMGIQMGLTGLGIMSITVLGYEEDCYYYNGWGGKRCDEISTEFLPIGISLLGVSAIFNIIRSYSYNEPKNYASNNHNGFNLAVLPNRNGEVMPYLMYNKTF